MTPSGGVGRYDEEVGDGAGGRPTVLTPVSRQPPSDSSRGGGRPVRGERAVLGERGGEHAVPAAAPGSHSCALGVGAEDGQRLGRGRRARRAGAARPRGRSRRSRRTARASPSPAPPSSSGKGETEQPGVAQGGPQLAVVARRRWPRRRAGAAGVHRSARIAAGEGRRVLLLGGEVEVHEVSSWVGSRSPSTGRRGQRLAAGRPRPTMPMMSRWISLVPPPNVITSEVRW